jgi:hypothetical protein
MFDFFGFDFKCFRFAKLAPLSTLSTWAFNANGKECKPHLQLENVMLMEYN